MVSELAVQHKAHPFTLPSVGDVIVSEETGAAYVIYTPFDEGGFGQIYFCEDEWGHELVAKVLKPIGPVEEMQVRAENEVLASAIVRSPHIIHVHDAFVFKGAYYIISERCVFSLRDLMAGDYNPILTFRPLCKALLHALHYMHTRGLAHCDVHEGNVLIHSKLDVIDPSKSVYDFKLGDFGQTRTIDGAHHRPTWNESCIPPEAIRPEDFGLVDHRADVYQVGLLLLKFYTRHRIVFNGDDILEGKPRQLAEAFGSPITDAVARMLRRHVEHRTPTALEAWRDIDAALKLQ